MPETRAAIDAATARIGELTKEIHAVRELLQEEKAARIREREEADAKLAEAEAKADEKLEAARRKVARGHRRLIAATALLAVATIVAVWCLAWVLHENERARCDRANEARRGTREAINLVYDDFARFPRVQATPGGVEYIEGRRAVVLDTLEKSQPILDC